MKIISLILAVITLLLSGCREPYFHMVSKENPEIEEYIINDDKDSVKIQVRVIYYFVYNASLNAEIAMNFVNDGKDTIILKNNTETFLSKYYSYHKKKFPMSDEGDIIIYPKNIEEEVEVVYNYGTGWPFPYNQKGWPKLPEDEGITFKLPTLVKGNRQISFKEIQFIPPKE